jgi:hypothetical protein
VLIIQRNKKERGFNMQEEYSKLRSDLNVKMQGFFGSEPKVVNALDDIIINCEYRIKRRIKASSISTIYENYYDVLYSMVKIDYERLGVESELIRDNNGIKTQVGHIRPSDEILSQIPLNIGAKI